MASVTKRRWTYKGVEKEAWTVRYKDARGVHRSKAFTKKKDADDFRRKAETELQQGVHVAFGASVTVAKLAEVYLESAQLRRETGRRMSASHLNTLNTMFRVHIVPHLGTNRLADLSWAIVDEWARLLSAKPSISGGTVKRIMHLFKVAMDFAIRREWVFRNVVAEVMKEYRGGHRVPIRTFTEAEARRLLQAVGHRPRNFTTRTTTLLRIYVYLGAFCGMRWGEIAGMKVEHINFEKGVLEIRHSLTAEDELKGPKTRAGVRDVPMPPVVADLLRQWLRSFYVENDRGLAFRRRGGGYMSCTNFHMNLWRKLLDRAELGLDAAGRRFHFHALRHFCASMMINHGVPLADVAELLGHSSFDVTLQVYAHTIAGGRRRIEILESVSVNLLAAPENVAQEIRIAA